MMRLLLAQLNVLPIGLSVVKNVVCVYFRFLETQEGCPTTSIRLRINICLRSHIRSRSRICSQSRSRFRSRIRLRLRSLLLEGRGLQGSVLESRSEELFTGGKARAHTPVSTCSFLNHDLAHAPGRGEILNQM